MYRHCDEFKENIEDWTPCSISQKVLGQAVFFNATGDTESIPSTPEDCKGCPYAQIYEMLLKSTIDGFNLGVSTMKALMEEKP